MPVIQKILSPEGQCTALWEITETEESLLQKLSPSDDDKKIFSSLKSEQRKREWLAVRALLSEVLPGNPEIAYKENGRPYLKGHSSQISISHSGAYVAIAIHPSATPGVDIELIHPRIKKIAQRFINDAEKSFLDNNTLLEQLCVIWCCKETLYKIHPEGMLNFKENLLISPFIFEDSGHITGRIITPQKTTVHKLSYTKIHNYILVNTDYNSGKVV